MLGHFEFDSSNTYEKRLGWGQIKTGKVSGTNLNTKTAGGAFCNQLG